MEKRHLVGPQRLTAAATRSRPRILAIVLAGGAGSRMGALTDRRANLSSPSGAPTA